ncbi:MAG: hypothetical protein ACI8SE_001684 [Bacteroidia bacterium]|jgi:hypothetical protein
MLIVGLSFSQCKSKSTKAICDNYTRYTDDVPFEMSVSDIVCNTNEDVCIVLDSVFDDSRCPTGLQCIWEGNAKMRFKFLTATGTYLFHLDTQPTSNVYQHDTTINGNNISLVNLGPYPDANSTTKITNYKATIKINPVK